jgi:glycosyltransferase involved in cell wall biosynthesis
LHEKASNILKVSVIIPIYNQIRFLEQAVNSALACPEVAECILVDDGSNDGSREMAEKLSRENDLVIFKTHPGNINKGISATRNLGLSEATQDYISFLDADDFFLENRFAFTTRIFKDSSADAVVEGLRSESIDGKYLGYTMLKEKLSGHHFFDGLEPFGKSGHFTVSSLTFSRFAFQKTGFFLETLKLTEDTEWISRLALNNRMAHGALHRAVAVRRIHDKNISKNIDLLHEERIKMCIEVLRTLVGQKESVQRRELVINTLLKYFFEGVLLNPNISPIQKKLRSIQLLRNCKKIDPGSGRYAKLQYFGKLVWRRKLPKGISFYD